MEYITTISSKGQITLPVTIRRQLNIHSGDRFRVVKKCPAIAIMADTYKEELDELRRQAQVHIKKHGLQNLSWAEIRERAEQEKLVEYEVRHGKRS